MTSMLGKLQVQSGRKTSLVFGCNGFIGGGLLKALTEKNYHVIGIHRGSNTQKSSNNIASSYTEVELKNIILTSCPDYVFLCYGPSSIAGSEIQDESQLSVTASVNTISTILEKSEKPCRLFLVSSSAIYGDQKELFIKENSSPKPVSNYGRKRLEIETILGKTRGDLQLQITILRIFSTFGVNQKKHVVWDMYTKFNQVLDNEILFRGTGFERRDFIHIDDLMDQILRLMEIDTPLPRRLNLGSGVYISTYDLAEEIKQISKSDKEFSFSGQVDPKNPKDLLPDLSLAKELGLPVYHHDTLHKKLIETFHSWDEE